MNYIVQYFSSFGHFKHLPYEFECSIVWYWFHFFYEVIDLANCTLLIQILCPYQMLSSNDDPFYFSYLYLVVSVTQTHTHTFFSQVQVREIKWWLCLCVIKKMAAIKIIMGINIREWGPWRIQLKSQQHIFNGFFFYFNIFCLVFLDDAIGMFRC